MGGSSSKNSTGPKKKGLKKGQKRHPLEGGTLKKPWGEKKFRRVLNKLEMGGESPKNLGGCSPRRRGF